MLFFEIKDLLLMAQTSTKLLELIGTGTLPQTGHAPSRRWRLCRGQGGFLDPVDQSAERVEPRASVCGGAE
jgi:hypothetical protein